MAVSDRRLSLSESPQQHAVCPLLSCGTWDRGLVAGLGAANLKAQDPRTWRGRNRLGFALMGVRERLR